MFAFSLPHKRRKLSRTARDRFAKEAFELHIVKPLDALVTLS
jgi:hypothetical protein